METAAPSLTEARPGHPLAGAAAIAAGGVAVRLALAALIPLTVDEAYYVDWARHLQPGYLDHPPAVAWLIAGPLRLFGASTLAVRLPALLLLGVATLLAADLARARGGPRAATAAALLLQAAPIFGLGATLVTPDAPLALAWVGALWSLDRAGRSGPRWFLATGAFVGLAALSKLTGGLLGLACLAALVATRDGRAALRTPWPWAGGALSLAVASPMLLWNAAHGWPAFGFQATHVLGGRGFSWARLAGSLGAQAAYVSPALLVLGAGAALRALRPTGRADAGGAALAFTALPLAALFTLAAAVTPGALPHWPAPAWCSAMVLLAAAGSRHLKWAAGVGLGMAALAVAFAVVLSLPLPPLPGLGRPLDELRGWAEGARAARAVAGPRPRLAVTHWIVLGELGWYDERSPAYLGERVSGPTFYDPAPEAAGEPLLAVTVDGLGPQRERVEARLGPVEAVGAFTARAADGREIRTYRFWRPAGARRAGPTG